MAFTSSTYRLIMLIALFIIAFTSYFCFDVPAALQDVLEQLLQINYTQYVLFYSLYSWPNVVLCLLGGYLMDSVLGESISVLIFACLSTGGQCLLATGSYLGMFSLMLVGRILYAIGNEPLGVAITTVIMKHFRGRQANLIFGLQTSIEFASDCLSLNVAFPIFSFFRSTFQTSHEPAAHTATLGLMLFAVAAVCGVSLLLAPAVIWLDRLSVRAKQSEKASRRVAESQVAVPSATASVVVTVSAAQPIVTSVTKPVTTPVTTPIATPVVNIPSRSLRAASDASSMMKRVSSHASLRAPRFLRVSESESDEESALLDDISVDRRSEPMRRAASTTFFLSHRSLTGSASVSSFNQNLNSNHNRGQPSIQQSRSTAPLRVPLSTRDYSTGEIESRQEIHSEARRNEQEEAPQDMQEAPLDPAQLGKVLRFPAGYWFLVGILMTYTGSVFSLIDVALVFYETKYGLDAVNANLANSLIYLVTVLACPLAGYAVDRYGRNVQFVLVSICVAMLAHGLLTFTFVSPFICSALLGVSYSLFASALWSMAVYLVPCELLGTAYGLLQAAENLALGLLILAVGALLDYAGYLINELFLFALASVALSLTVLLYGWSYCHTNPRYSVLHLSAARRIEVLSTLDVQQTTTPLLHPAV